MTANPDGERLENVNIQYVDRMTKIISADEDGIEKAAVESFSRRYADVMSVVRKNSEKVKEINEKIVELIDMKRMYLLDTHTEVGRFLANDMFIDEVRKAYVDYGKVGMKSKLVKDVVMSTRGLFFDDTSETFRKYEFVSFTYDSSHDMSYKLWFSNGKKEFAISIPGHVKTLSELNKDENVGSMFRVVFSVGKYIVTSMGGKMTVEGIRNDLKTFVSDDFVPSDRLFPRSEGSITPLDVIVDKCYGVIDGDDTEIPYYFRRDIRRKGLV